CEAWDGFMGHGSPVAETNVRLVADQAGTLAAIDKEPPKLEATIRQSPPTLDVSTASLKVQQPFLVDLTTFSRYMQPATAALRAALPQINPALEAGVRVRRRTAQMERKLPAVLGQLKTTALDPGTNVALNALTATVGTLNPTLRYIGPFVTVCNGWNYFWAELQDLVSEETQFGMAQRALANFANHQTNNVGQQGATAPANGYQPGDPPDQSLGADAEFNHGPVYGAAIDNQGNADCEVGQRGYQLQQNTFDQQHRNLVSDAHTPGNQGSVWNGLTHVPQGETFSREPTTGPALPFYPSGNN